MRTLRSTRLQAAALLAAASLVTLTQAAPPWQNLIPFRQSSRVTIDEPLDLEDSHGPWMILAAVFAGDASQREATQLAEELRSRYQLPAYLFRKHFDYTEPVEGLGVDQYRRPKRMRYAQAEEFDEVAVLVGNYSSINDPELQETLKKIKTLQPRSLSKVSPNDTTLRFAALRQLQRQWSGEEREKGPLSKAFATRNPLLPQEYFVPRGVDKLTLEMNQGVKYSLLDCPGRYSVRIATFGGKVIIDQKRVQEIEQGEKQLESKLEEAAVKAHKLTVALRRRGIPAYEFHDRYESIVTVGSYENVGTETADGKIDLNPEVYKVMAHFSARRRAFEAQTGADMTGLEPHEVEGITLDVQPIPVEVPKRSIATDYATGRR